MPALAETLEGLAAGDMTWSSLAKWRARLLTCHVPRERDLAGEMRERLRLWERGDIINLVIRVQGCRVGIEESRKRKPPTAQRNRCGEQAEYIERDEGHIEKP